MSKNNALNNASSSRAQSKQPKKLELVCQVPGNGEASVSSLVLNGLRLHLAKPIPSSEVRLEGTMIRFKNPETVISAIELLDDDGAKEGTGVGVGEAKSNEVGIRDTKRPASPSPSKPPAIGILQIVPAQNEEPPKKRAPPPVIGSARKADLVVPHVQKTPRVGPAVLPAPKTPMAKRPTRPPPSVDSNEPPVKTHRYNTRGSSETPKGKKQ